MKDSRRLGTGVSAEWEYAPTRESSGRSMPSNQETLPPDGRLKDKAGRECRDRQRRVREAMRDAEADPGGGRVGGASAPTSPPAPLLPVCCEDGTPLCEVPELRDRTQHGTTRCGRKQAAQPAGPNGINEIAPRTPEAMDRPRGTGGAGI